MMSNKKLKETKKSEQHVDDIKGFDIQINEFGEVVCSHDMNSINSFLDEHVVDKKLPDAMAAKKEKVKE